MLRTRPTLPTGHGEVLTSPPYREWAELLRGNRAATAGWGFTIAGRPYAELRSLARRELIDAASFFSARIGVPVAEAGDPEAPIVLTGHQPELYHTGVWVKDFLLQRVADETGATAIDVVVDSDAFDMLAIVSPCMAPEVRRCRHYLAVGASDRCFACTPSLTPSEVDRFAEAASTMLATLPAPAVLRHFETFVACLREAAADAETLAELITFARRRYEAPAGTDYLELPVTTMARTEAWATFVAGIALDAVRFAEDYNAELAEYRRATRTRSSAQPFPDLAIDGDAVELPLWALESQHRSTVWARRGSLGVELVAEGSVIARLGESTSKAIDAVRGSAAIIAPKALMLTMFNRLFVCDLFIHGVGGGRYDAVTDGVCRRYFGVEPPRFVVASMSMYLPLGVRAVTEEEVAAAKDRLNRLQHNPDALLGEVEFDDPAHREQAAVLAAEKARLVAAIAEPDADKKALGMRIREVNAGLSRLLEPLAISFEQEVARLEGQRAAADVLTDRTYPFCFWSPHEIADKVR